jgi:hypothetical protein
MTINASSYFRPCDCEGGVVDVDMTIYLAPNDPNYSPTGVVGDDVNGDGTDIRPFFSIKRAMEYLENYRIKVGAYVTIRGLPGHYHYNENHAVEIKHKDAKYIKVQFDMLESGNYHVTSVTTNTVTVTNNSDHDLVEFTVNDIGTGFYSIKAGDYIKISPDNILLEDPVKAVWAGYFRVYSVSGNTITIVYKREQIGGLYNSGHSYGFPATLVSGDGVNVIKFSTHQYMNCTSGTIFFKSEYGFGGLQINASDESYYVTNGVSGSHKVYYVSIYDGIINDMVLNFNGFAIGGLFENLQYNTYLDSNLYLRSCTTSCTHGIEFKQSNVNLIGFIGNNCIYPVIVTATILNCVATTLKTVVYNSYYHGWQVTSRSTFRGPSLPTAAKTINSFYNDSGMSIWTSSSYGGTGLNIMYNNVGIGISSSELRFFIIYDNGNIRANISYNTSGINVFFSGVLDVSYSEIHHNTYGIYTKDSSNVVSTANVTDSTLIHDNTSTGIYCEYNSLIKIHNLKSYNNSKDGIFCARGSNAHLNNCEIYNNGRHGIYTHDTSTASIYNTNIDNNTTYGIQAKFNNKVFLYNVAVTNSGSYNLYFVYNSHCDVNNPNAKALTSITPSKNTAPTYGNGTNGCYIIEYLYTP